MRIEDLNTGTILSQILILYVLIAIGFIAGKTGYLPKTSGQVISKLVMRVTMPALILSKMLSADFSADNYFDGIKLIAIAVIFLLIVFVITIFRVARTLCRMPAGYIQAIARCGHI